jgi:peptidoglycan/LPS O-acetylase OafA/YrhL
VATQSLAEHVSPGSAGFLSKLATITSCKYIGMFGLGILIYDGQRGTDAVQLRLLAAGCCLASISLRSGVETMTIDAALALVLWMAVNGKMVWLNAKWLTFLGAISYTLYLTHQNIGYIVISRLQQNGVHPIATIIAAFGVALALAVALHHLVERPSLNRLRRVDITSIGARFQQRVVALKMPTKQGRVH